MNHVYASDQSLSRRNRNLLAGSTAGGSTALVSSYALSAFGLDVPVEVTVAGTSLLSTFFGWLSRFF